MTEKETLPVEIQWIVKNKALINIHQIELACGMSHNILWGYLKGRSTLAKHWHPKLVEWVRSFIKLK